MDFKIEERDICDVTFIIYMTSNNGLFNSTFSLMCFEWSMSFLRSEYNSLNLYSYFICLHVHIGWERAGLCYNSICGSVRDEFLSTAVKTNSIQGTVWILWKFVQKCVNHKRRYKYMYAQNAHYTCMYCISFILIYDIICNIIPFIVFQLQLIGILRWLDLVNKSIIRST